MADPLDIPPFLRRERGDRKVHPGPAQPLARLTRKTTPIGAPIPASFAKAMAAEKAAIEGRLDETIAKFGKTTK